MNSGQMMISIAALGLLTFTILNFNRGTISTQDALIYNKEFIVATTVAQSILDEISSKTYDEEIAIGSSISSASDFSTTLAAESGETYPDYDDVDDYNNYTTSDTIPQMGVFNTSVTVTYMTDSFAETTAKTYNKNVTVEVTSPTLINFYTEVEDTLRISSLFSHWGIL